MKTREVLAKNIRALMEAKPELGTLTKITAATDGRLSNGKLDRIRRATHATDIDTLNDLAEVFGVETWQLLVPDLNARALPQIAGPELLATIRALVFTQMGDLQEKAAPSIPSGEQAHPRATKSPLGRLPGEIYRADQVGSGSNAVDRPGKTQAKRGSKRA